MGLPEISIVILNYNTYELTRAAIRSVLEKTEGVGYQLIVVDNASTECAPEKFKEEFPEIILIKSTENGGFAKGNNLGISKAKGEYILLLNSDAELKNNAVKLAMERMAQDPTIGALSAKLMFSDGRLQHPAQRFETLARELRELFRINKFMTGEQRAKYYLGDAFDHQSEIECDWVWGAFFMFRKEILEQLPNKRLADNFFMYAEDVQWCYQIKELGYKMLYSPGAEVIHHMGGSDTKEQVNDEKYFSRLLPNTYKVLQMEKGRVYAFATYAIRALHLLTLRTKSNRVKAWKYIRLILGS